MPQPYSFALACVSTVSGGSLPLISAAPVSLKLIDAATILSRVGGAISATRHSISGLPLYIYLEGPGDQGRDLLWGTLREVYYLPATSPCPM